MVSPVCVYPVEEKIYYSITSNFYLSLIFIEKFLNEQKKNKVFH